MRFRICFPDLSVHDERTCGGLPHCKVAETRTGWHAAYPIAATVPSELAAVRFVRERYPDAIAQPHAGKIGDEETVLIFLLESEEALRKAATLKQRMNPVCIVEPVGDTREECKAIRKAKGILDRNLWLQGWISPLAEIFVERSAEIRTSQRVGPVTETVQLGKNKNGRWELQVPTALSIELSDEMLERIANLPR